MALLMSRRPRFRRETGGSLTALETATPTPTPNSTTLAEQMTEFMFSIVTAYDSPPGSIGLGTKGGAGVANLAKQTFYFGINDTLQGI